MFFVGRHTLKSIRQSASITSKVTPSTPGAPFFERYGGTSRTSARFHGRLITVAGQDGYKNEAAAKALAARGITLACRHYGGNSH